MSDPIILQPPGSLVAGAPGSGKTFSIATQLLCGLEVFVIVTEPDGLASLLDACETLKAPVDRLHWTLCLPTTSDWTSLLDMVGKVNSMDQKGIADIRDLGKASFRPAAEKFIRTFSNFKCERTGESYGDFCSWNDTRILNVDSFTGWSSIMWGLTVGHKPTANPGEWGIAQNVIWSLLQKVNSDRRCFFNMTAHVEKENDDISGIRRLMVSTIGAKLAPKVPSQFSEFIRATRQMDNNGKATFVWSTLDNSMELKNRALPIGTVLPATFRPIYDAHQRRKKLVNVSGEAQASPSVARGEAQVRPPPQQTPATPVPPAAPMGRPEDRVAVLASKT